MKPQLIVIDTVQDTEALLSYLQCFTMVAYDLETTGLLSTSQVVGMSFCTEENIAFYVILHKWENGSLIPVLDKQPSVLALVDLLTKMDWIGHNALFDASMTENYFKVKIIDTLHTDTMVLAHLLNENRRKGLKELSKDMYGEDSAKEQEQMKASVIVNGGKLTKKTYEMYKCDAHILGTYGAKDALLTFKLFNDLFLELHEQGLEDFFYRDECMPLLRGPTYQLNTTGLKVDQPRLASLKKQLEAECLEAKNYIYAEIQAKIKDKYPGTSSKNTFNIGSNQQLSELLFGIYELEFGTLTSTGKALARSLGLKYYSKPEKRNFIHAIMQQAGGISSPATMVNGKQVKAKKIKEPWSYIQVDKKTLAKIAPKLTWVAKLLEYQRKNKILKTYVKGLEERIQYGIIRPSFNQTGTTSGRYSSTAPNFQNLPRDDKRVKECIISRPGKVFVGADYSQLEPRVFAFFSKDARLIEAFKSADDFYSVIGMHVFDKFDCHPRKDDSPDSFAVKYKKLRDISKVIALASTYGSTAFQLMRTVGKSEEDTQLDIDNYFERFPGVAKMMTDAHNTVKEKGQVVNLFGRPRRIPDALKINKIFGNKSHAEYDYRERNLLNLAVNHPIQSTGASICNRAMITFYNNIKELGIEAPIVCQVHDSVVVECKIEDAESVTLLLQSAMENTISLGEVKLEAIPKTGTNLAEV